MKNHKEFIRLSCNTSPSILLEIIMIRFNFIICLIFVASCGSDDSFESSGKKTSPINSCQSSVDRLTGQVIIGDLDWNDYLDLKNTRKIRNSKTTGQINIPIINANCTAFLVNENTIMTNNHCVPNDLHAEGVRLFLRDEDKSKETFFCDKLLATNASLDFSLLECNGYPGDKYGFIPLGQTSPSKNQNMYLVQENCDYLSNPRCTVHKYLAKGVIRRVGVNSIHHDADTLGGSSGSPIFNQNTHELIGIHNAGRLQSGSTPAMNFGIPMHRISNYLSNNHPEIKIYQSAINDSCN